MARGGERYAGSEAVGRGGGGWTRREKGGWREREEGCWRERGRRLEGEMNEAGGRDE
jgi:hypothetical protein